MHSIQKRNNRYEIQEFAHESNPIMTDTMPRCEPCLLHSLAVSVAVPLEVPPDELGLARTLRELFAGAVAWCRWTRSYSIPSASDTSTSFALTLAVISATLRLGAVQPFVPDPRPG
jgi:hypothetical protein